MRIRQYPVYTGLTRPSAVAAMISARTFAASSDVRCENCVFRWVRWKKSSISAFDQIFFCSVPGIAGGVPPGVTKSAGVGRGSEATALGAEVDSTVALYALKKASVRST